MRKPTLLPVTKTHIFAAIVLCSAALFFGCSQNKSAVVLWSPSPDQFPHGSIVSVISEGEDTSIIKAPNDSEQENLSIESWRIRSFEEAEAARDFHDAYQQVADTTAVSQRNALPMRAESNSSAPITYRLREGEEIKILSQSDEPVEVGNLQDFWYEGLTDSGITGYVFGFYLNLLDPTSEIQDERDEILDERLKSLLSSVWRPIEFRRMIEEEQIIPDRLRPRYGLFFNTEEQRIDIVLRQNSFVLGYDEIQQTNSRTYLFTGADTTVQFVADDEVQVQFPVGNRTQSESFVILEEDIEDLRTAEFARRQIMLEQILEGGTELSSTAYGTIQLQPDGSFEWTGLERLQPRIIPSDAENSGMIEFTYFRDPSLQAQYQGTVAFRFTGSDTPVVFLYEKVNNGLRLTYVPRNTISNQTVESVSLSPTILFFQYQESE
ncbi:MAG: SH3 domain-containing protein [Spirochaeta sp.]